MSSDLVGISEDIDLAFRRALRTGEAPETLTDKPRKTWTAMAAQWRLLKALQDRHTVTLDHLVLLRQVVRWNGPTFVGTLAAAWHNRLGAVGLSLSPSGELTARPYRPAWLSSESWSGDGALDIPPAPRLPDESLLAEPWLSLMGPGLGFTRWQSSAQKEACWQALTTQPGGTCLVGLPTGAGKSLVFQLLARFTSGLTVVIVPTIALAIDQRESARRFMDRVSNLNPRFYEADDTSAEAAGALQALRDGECRLLFASPEACVSGRLRSVLDELSAAGRLQNLVVDEAHIIDSWGSHFRVDFQLLAVRAQKWRERSDGRLRTFLLSATFTPECRQMLQELFAGADGWREFSCQRLRPEMIYFAQRMPETAKRNACVLDALHHLPRPAILYTTERAEAVALAKLCDEAGFQRVGCFHGDTKPAERSRLLKAWRADEIDLMVATSAFGMGVDKPDVRAVVHACMPETLHRYYQEVGRGGRDGASAVCLLMPTTRDHEIAKGLLPTLLGDVKLTLRWEALLKGAVPAEGSGVVLDLPLDARHKALIGQRSYRENVRWNKRLCLMLVRAGQLDLLDLWRGDPREAGGERVEWLRVRCHFPPDSPALPTLVQGPRQEELEQGSRGLGLLETYLDGAATCRLLRRQYGRDTLVACGGCPACRRDGGSHSSVPLLSFDATAPGSPRLQVVAGLPIWSGQRGRQDWVRLLRDLVKKHGRRRFLCPPAYVEEIRALFLEAFDTESAALYRLDPVGDTTPVIADSTDTIVCIHGDAPSAALLALRHGRLMCHLFPANAALLDANGRTPLSGGGASFFPSPEAWMAVA